MITRSNYGTIARTRTFAEIYPTLTDFTEQLTSSGLYNPSFKQDSCSKLYYLLYAAYGNSHVASADENQFKYKLYAIVFSRGLQWQKAVEMQQKLNDLEDADILSRGSNLTNHANNPGTGGVAVTKDSPILDYVNDQSSTLSQSDKTSAYVRYIQSLVDVTTDFIDSLKRLFLTVVYPERALWYVTDDGE